MRDVSRASKAALELTAGHWSQYEPDLERSFFGFPGLRPYLIASAFGESAANKHADNRWWAEDIVVERYLADRPISSVLSLCCGFGATEQHLVQRLSGVRVCQAVDVAPGAIAEARRRAEAAGLGEIIRYEVADLNSFTWSPDAFDLVVANGALHHLANLEDVLDGVRCTLAPGGVFYANEHIGAQHRRFSARQLELINAAAYLVPPDRRSRHPARHNPFAAGRVKRLADVLLGNADLGRSCTVSGRSASWHAVARLLRSVTLRPRTGFGPIVTVEDCSAMATDPTEGISSDRIVPGILARFSGVHTHHYGGAMLAYALDQEFYDRYEPDNRRDAGLLKMLCTLEASLVELGELPMEHAIMVAVQPGRGPSGVER